MTKKTGGKPPLKGRKARRRRVLLSRKTRIRKVRKVGVLKGRHKRIGLKLRRKGLRLRRKKRLRHRKVAAIPVVQLAPPPPPPAPPEPVVVPLPADPGVPPETPPPDAYQQGYHEAYDVGFDAGFAKGFEEGHKLEFK